MASDADSSITNKGTQPEAQNGIGMTGGQGPRSYAQNSGDQRRAVTFFYDLLREAIHKMGPPKETPLRIADFGCSSGPNCASHMDTIATWFREQADERQSPLEIQYFFSDLPSTDFNNLFRILAERSGAAGTPFVAGVPGSFVKRLLPKCSIHLAISTFALHWATERKLDVGGHVYAKQAMVDLRNFLKARAEEMVPGGLLFVEFFGRAGDDPTKQLNQSSMLALMSDAMQDAWTELISQGILDDEEGSKINLPVFCRSEQEVRDVVEEFSNDFSIYKLGRIEKLSILEPGQEIIENPVDIVKKLGVESRSLLSKMFELQIGKQRTELLFQKMEQNMLALLAKRKIDMGSYYDVIFALLEHK